MCTILAFAQVEILQIYNHKNSICPYPIVIFAFSLGFGLFDGAVVHLELALELLLLLVDCCHDLGFADSVVVNLLLDFIGLDDLVEALH